MAIMDINEAMMVVKGDHHGDGDDDDDAIMGFVTKMATHDGMLAMMIFATMPMRRW